MVYGLLNQPPRRPPFSDWRAQVERIIQRESGERVNFTEQGSDAIRPYYDVGLSPHEAAEDFLS